MTDHRTRALLVIVALCIGFTIISARLVQIMLIEHRRYEDFAIANHWRKIELQPVRGDILDAQGKTLAKTQVTYDIRLDGRALKKPLDLFQKLAPVLDHSATMLLANYDSENGYWLLKEDVDEYTVAQLEKLKREDFTARRRLIIERKTKRVYPNGLYASQVIGLLRGEKEGISGIEKEMDYQLRGLPGERWYEKDNHNREIVAYRRKDQPAINGSNIALTIDLTVQHIVEEEIDKIMEEHEPQAAHIVVMDPHTGEILAVANRPTFDPNDRSDLTMELTKNASLTKVVEPGSTFKLVPLAAALEEGTVRLDTPIHCENGSFYYGGSQLTDTHAYGTLTVKEAFAKSSNIGMAKLAINMGEHTLYRYIRNFGFGDKWDLLRNQGESGGIIHPVDRWSKISVTRIPIGHEVSVTPLQVVLSASVIANGGELVEPRLIRQITNAEGRIVKLYRPEPVRRVISQRTASEVAAAMEYVVTNGTGKAAAVDGFSVGGKTGTAQKLVPHPITGKMVYSDKHYVASFVGFMPVENPRFVMLVMVDDPSQGKHYGGNVAAPAFSNMALPIAQALGMEPAHLRQDSAPHATAVIADSEPSEAAVEALTPLVTDSAPQPAPGLEPIVPLRSQPLSSGTGQAAFAPSIGETAQINEVEQLASAATAAEPVVEEPAQSKVASAAEAVRSAQPDSSPSPNTASPRDNSAADREASALSRRLRNEAVGNGRVYIFQP